MKVLILPYLFLISWQAAASSCPDLKGEFVLNCPTAGRSFSTFILNQVGCNSFGVRIQYYNSSGAPTISASQFTWIPISSSRVQLSETPTHREEVESFYDADSLYRYFYRINKSSGQPESQRIEIVDKLKDGQLFVSLAVIGSGHAKPLSSCP